MPTSDSYSNDGNGRAWATAIFGSVISLITGIAAFAIVGALLAILILTYEMGKANDRRQRMICRHLELIANRMERDLPINPPDLEAFQGKLETELSRFVDLDDITIQIQEKGTHVYCRVRFPERRTVSVVDDPDRILKAFCNATSHETLLLELAPLNASNTGSWPAT